MQEFPKPGEIFNHRYELLEVLGSGGIGTVFKALQLESKRLVALKVMHRSLVEDADAKKRFLREARTLNQLRHRGIVTFYHIGISDTGLAYIAMEHIYGLSLRQLLNKEHSLPALRAIGVAKQLAVALAYVHTNGIVHRDIKPENVILVDTPEPDTAKLIDFGLARLEAEQQLTITGLLIGSVNYMSPEQCLGKKADERSDIYSLAICLYEMLTGNRPFLADTPVGLMYKQANEPLPIVEESQVDQFLPDINAILSRAAAKSPDERYSSMNELAGALDSLSQALKEVEQSRKKLSFCKVSPNAVLITAICLVLALGILAFYGRSIFPGIFQKAMLVSNSALKNDGRSSQLKRLSVPLDYSPNVEGQEPAFFTEIAKLKEQHDYKAAESKCLAAIKLVEQQREEYPEWLFRAHILLAYIYTDLKEYDKACKEFRAAMEMFQLPNSYLRLDALNMLCHGLVDAGKPKEAIQTFKQNLAAAERSLDGDLDTKLAHSYFDFASILKAQGSIEEALKMEKKGLNILWRAPDYEIDEGTIDASWTAFELYSRLGKTAEGNTVLEKCRNMLKKQGAMSLSKIYKATENGYMNEHRIERATHEGLYSANSALVNGYLNGIGPVPGSRCHAAIFYANEAMKNGRLKDAGEMLEFSLQESRKFSSELAAPLLLLHKASLAELQRLQALHKAGRTPVAPSFTQINEHKKSGA